MKTRNDCHSAMGRNLIYKDREREHHPYYRGKGARQDSRLASSENKSESSSPVKTSVSRGNGVVEDII